MWALLRCGLMLKPLGRVSKCGPCYDVGSNPDREGIGILLGHHRLRDLLESEALRWIRLRASTEDTVLGAPRAQGQPR